MNLPICGVVALLLMFIEPPEQASKPSLSVATVINILLHKLDLVGFTLLAPAAIQLLLALDYGEHVYGWKDSTPIGLFCGAGATFVVFLLWERHQGDGAMIPLKMIKNRVVWTSCLTQRTAFCMSLVASFYLPLYFQGIKDATPVMSGVYMLPGILFQLLFAIVCGGLSKCTLYLSSRYRY